MSTAPPPIKSERPWNWLEITGLVDLALTSFGKEVYGQSFDELPERERRAVIEAMRSELLDRLQTMRDERKARR